MRSATADDYRVAREADELEREARDYGYATERAMHKADGVRQPITFKQWLEQTSYTPAPDEVDGVLESYAREVRARMREAEQVFLEASEAYRAEVATLAECGWSLRRIARALEVSPQRIQQLTTGVKR